ncbi:hypothetical protein CEK28_15595 [Xenophilus sp. AP218F]|nr:hypothetical protein CEK28_15595 [Xenophilus sp. AP218F]
MRIEYQGKPIRSIKALSTCLGVSEDSLSQISLDIENQYSISEIPKKKGGFRTISDPLPPLKIIQRRIVRRIFSNIKFPDYLFGSIKDDNNPRDFYKNALYHQKAKEVLSFDIESFFPSCRPKFIYKIYKYLFNFSDEVSHLLVNLTTLNNGLPQGAPTSSYLANLFFYDNEHKIFKTLKSKGFLYSRLIDDIVVSKQSKINSNEKQFIYRNILSLLREKEVNLNKDKYSYSNTKTHGKKTIITGLQVRNGNTILPKEKTTEIHKKIHEIEHLGEVDRTSNKFHEAYGTASGLLALYKRVDITKAEKLHKKIITIKPIYHPNRIKKIKWICNKFVRISKSNPRRIGEYNHAKKYHRLMHKISIIRRTHTALAKQLKARMQSIKPTRLLSEYEP